MRGGFFSMGIVEDLRSGVRWLEGQEVLLVSASALPQHCLDSLTV